MNYVVCPESEATHVRFHNGVIGEIHNNRLLVHAKELLGKTVGVSLEILKDIGAIQAWLKVREPARWQEVCKVANREGLAYVALPPQFMHKTVKDTIEEVV